MATVLLLNVCAASFIIISRNGLLKRHFSFFFFISSIYTGQLHGVFISLFRFFCLCFSKCCIFPLSLQISLQPGPELCSHVQEQSEDAAWRQIQPQESKQWQVEFVVFLISKASQVQPDPRMCLQCHVKQECNHVRVCLLGVFLCYSCALLQLSVHHICQMATVFYRK